ncbi:hypothetical protein Btru_013945 [Bulinus truncatus]|nr:hypothetical protein Btru_013945 [Bulinus truncatus]
MAVKCMMICLIYFLELTTSQDKVCDDGDFCTFKCHCNHQCSTTTGHCPSNAKCYMGWFGLRCQYEDLVSISGANVSTSPVLPNVDWLTDRNDSTCNTDKRLQSITVTWDKSYPLTWLRITLSEPTMLSSIKIKYNSTKGDAECQSQRLFLLGDGTMDIRCYIMVVMQRLTILGNITSLCSLYVSGGRNIAFQQSASQSTTLSGNGFVYSANLAVDGKADGNFLKSSCSHTSPGDPSPRFDLILQTPYFVNRFVMYNRDGSYSIRLKGFRLVALNNLNKTVFDYKDNSSDVQSVYFVNVNVQQPIKSITVNETREAGIYLTICEIEAYGECPTDRWSLPCTRQCNSSCPTSCHIDDGSCSSVCVGYSNPPVCSRACDVGKWGINCRNDCSNRCVNLSCHFKTGQCVQGCYGYSDPPYCTQACEKGIYGSNCSRYCSSQCSNGECDAVTGFCFSCLSGYMGNTCDQEDSADLRQFNNDFGAGFGAGAAAVILIGVVLAIICIYCRRRTAPTIRLSHQHEYDQPARDQPASSAESKDVYETIQSGCDTKITNVKSTIHEEGNYCNVVDNNQFSTVAEHKRGGGHSTPSWGGGDTAPSDPPPLATGLVRGSNVGADRQEREMSVMQPCQ